MKSLILVFLISISHLTLAQDESGVLDGVFVEEIIPTRSHVYQRPIYVDKLEDTILNIEYVDLTADSLELRYTHSTYGLVVKELDSVVKLNDILVQKLIKEGHFYCSHRYVYSLVLANFTDRIQFFHEGELVFSISYYNFINEAYWKGRSVLFDDLILKMRELRAIAPSLNTPYVETNTD